jgi:hypothetical protein
MAPSTVLRPQNHSPVRWRGVFAQDVVVIVLVGVIAVVLAQLFVTTPARRSLTLVNDSDYELTVEAARPGDTSWAPIAILDPRQPERVTRPIDQGDEWVLRFRSQGRSGGEVAVAREQLDQDGWRFVIPPTVAEELEAAGATPPPRGD